MKVIVAVIFAIGSVSAARSGPYLPSGWKPSGPAFYLPTEVQKPADNPVKDLLFASEASGSEDLREYGPPKLTVESETSGSEGLKEYGPPKETLIIQTLPDVVTEQTFYVIDGSALVEQQQEADVNSEQRADLTQEATTEAQVTEAKTQNFDDTDVTVYEAVTDKSEAEVAKQVEIVTENVEIATENVEVATDKAVLVEDAVKVESTVVAVEEKIENVAVEQKKLENIVVQEKEQIAEVVEAVEGIKNIAEAVVAVDSDIKPEEVQQSLETVGKLKVNQAKAEVKVPEGFLEYGPPGFREYGPPKRDELRLVTANEVRRRRFSPKFRSLVNRKH